MDSNFKDLYKKGVDRGEQQKLRQLHLLKEQKLRRQQEQDTYRQVSEQSSPSKPQQKKHRHKNNNKKRNSGGRGLHFRPQLSEWLRHRPENLNDWLLVPCPIGKRCLVYASQGKTKVYSKAGWQFMQLRTLLPGDGQLQKFNSILDCVYVEALDTFYVLDALAFGQQQLKECEATFRFYWLRARFEEQQHDLSQRGERNESSFVLLDHYDFENPSAVEQVLQKYPIWQENQPKLDGFLFYHKQASYECGTTPLVCWLFAYMLPDVLGWVVNDQYEAPEDYQPALALEYMDEFDRKLQEQRKLQQKQIRQRKTESAMKMIEDLEESDEDACLKSLLEHERRLELGELDMDCSESPAATAVSC